MFLFLLACTPRVIRYPGPVMGLGRSPVSVFQKSVEQPLDNPVVEQPKKKGAKLAQAARSFVGAKSLLVGDKTFGYHCSGYISAVFAKAGYSVEGSTKHLYDTAKKQGFLSTKPQVGSIVFFDNTYDANKNGRFDDPLSHVAMIEKIHSDGRIDMLHLGSRGITSLTLHLEESNRHKTQEGILYNSFLRVRTSRQDNRPRLAGELWKGFAYWELQ